MKRILILLWILLSALLPACSATPFKYDDLEAEAKRTGDTTRLERYEARVSEAEQFYEARSACIRHNDYVWTCVDRQRFDAARPPQSADELLRVYRFDRFNCSCQIKRELF